MEEDEEVHPRGTSAAHNDSCSDIDIPETAKATTLFVGGAGPGNYTTIQAAVDAGAPGDTVYVYNGTYYEHIIVSKTLSLVGEDKNATVIHGSGTNTGRIEHQT